MLTLNDGRTELWQWDTGRTLAVDADCSQVHFSNKVFGRSIDVDVVGGAAIIPDILLQTDKDLNVWAFVGTAENGYTKISKTFKVNRRNKPADYVFTPTEQTTLSELAEQIGNLDDLTTEAKDNLVAAINEAAKSGGGGSVQPDWNQNDKTAKDYIKNRPGGYIEEGTTFPLVINATKQDGINELTIVHVFEDNFIYKDSINVKILYSSGTINRTLVKRHIPKHIINESGTDIYGNAHLINAMQPDTGEDLAIFYEYELGADYNVGWHVWAPSLPSGDFEVTVVEETMRVVPFSSEFMPWEASPTADSVLYTAQSLTEEERAQARANIDAGTPYTLPQATAKSLGGVKADSAEAADTQPVRIGEDGKLYTAPGGTDISLGLTSVSVGQTIKVKAMDDSGKPTAWEAVDMPSGGGGASYRSWSKVWSLAVAEDIAGFEASNIDLDGKSEIMIVFISDSTASRAMVNGRLIINGVDAGKVLFNSLQLKKDSHSFVIIGRADDGIEYTTMQASAEYQTYPWQGEVKIVHRMVSGTSSIIQWTAGSTIEITQASATLGQGVTIEIYVR